MRRERLEGNLWSACAGLSGGFSLLSGYTALTYIAEKEIHESGKPILASAFLGGVALFSTIQALRSK